MPGAHVGATDGQRPDLTELLIAQNIKYAADEICTILLRFYVIAGQVAIFATTDVAGSARGFEKWFMWFDLVLDSTDVRNDPN